ncbi:SPOR domain-containing protein [Frigoribacterium sp. ACAM 257]|uniref:SPOR domain-containing protein n=1 Tax=Frigoribacterium sp. ACAM 257 TaxID=2508998 RepID=UPI0011BA2EC5|nr:SPOR domain-containing protein [Frigoribacterium sp. ACAM 257]TWX40618.1 SPOR domain-containing protein [Frigoribacterium sp. ACAM 257]
MTNEFWFNTRTHEVEEGKVSPAVDRAGPYATREEAAAAIRTIQERNARLDAEDAADA